MTEAAFQHGKIADFLQEVRRAPSSALLLDFDGTLAPFSLDRNRALPYEGVQRALQEIVDTERTRLVIVTGRDAREIAPLLGIRPAPEVWGVHGLQRMRPNGMCEMPEIPASVEEALDEARRWLAYQNLRDLAETKPGAIAVHWRGINDADTFELRSKILLGWNPIAVQGELELLEFDGGVEIRMSGPNKGDAVMTILEEVGAHAAVAYLGDDLTDERAFEALGDRGLTVLVRPQLRPTSAQVWITAPDGLLQFLYNWVEAVETEFNPGNTALSL